MTTIDPWTATPSDSEETSQRRVAKFFEKKLGYIDLGNWQKGVQSQNHTCLEREQLRQWLQSQNKYSDAVIENAILKLEKKIAECDNAEHTNLYEINRDCNLWMWKGIDVDNPDDRSHKIRVEFVDWEHVENNEFAVAREVWFENRQEATDRRRADFIIYLNGMAVADIELKAARVSMHHAIDQLRKYVRNNRSFFALNAMLVAGNESEGLKYGAILADEQYYSPWQESEPHLENERDRVSIALEKRLSDVNNSLLRGLGGLFDKSRLLDIMRWCTLFDGGAKKLPRYHQYFANVTARERLKKEQGGIIWHTQGSGKTITMICLMRWILENMPDPRIMAVTDREELDKMFNDMMNNNKEMFTVSYGRATSCNDLRNLIEENIHIDNATSAPRGTKVICTLIHKFLKKQTDRTALSDAEYEREAEQAAKQIAGLGKLKFKGRFYVFIDECHRSHSGALHKAMKTLLNDAIMIGFTGTPILACDKEAMKRNSRIIFGDYIHTYKYDRAVQDKVVLPLRYEARKSGIVLKDGDKDDIDGEFEAYLDGKYPKISEEKREQFRRRVAELAYDDENRLVNVVKDIMSDYKKLNNNDKKLPNPRLQGRGNAILAAQSVYRAFKYYEIFRDRYQDFKCAVISSYEGNKEAAESNKNDDEAYKARMYQQMLRDWGVDPNAKKEAELTAQTFERKITEKFIKEPESVKLLIVCDKLLTGFDAPSCSVLYIDKSLRDHGLFQAICRVNRLDSADKEWGQIVDYRFLLDRVKDAMTDYTGDTNIPGFDPNDLSGMLKVSSEEALVKFNEMYESLEALCEDCKQGVDINLEKAKRYFVTDNQHDDEKLGEEKSHRRADLYQWSASLIRNYHNMTEEARNQNKRKLKKYADLRETIKQLSADDTRIAIDADLRRILSDHISAKKVETAFSTNDLSRLNAIENRTERIKAIADQVDSNSSKKDKDFADESIAANTAAEIREHRHKDEHKYKLLSELLQQIIDAYVQGQIDFETLVKRVNDEIVNKIDQVTESLPKRIRNAERPHACEALYHGLMEHEGENCDIIIPEDCQVTIVALTLDVDDCIHTKAPADWKSSTPKTIKLKGEVYRVLERYGKANIDIVELLLKIAKEQDEY